MKAGFIGLGRMGRPMAVNLVKKGFDTIVWNRTRSVAEELGTMGAKVAKTPREVGENSNVIFICVPDEPQVREVIFGEEGICADMRKGGVIADCSTIDPWKAKRIAEDLAKEDIYFLDAPITGGTAGAEEGTITFMVGGEKEIFEKIKPMFEAMGKRAFYMGDSGMGQHMKIVNNLISGIFVAGIAEGLVLGAKAGLDPSLMIEVLSNGGGRSGVLDFMGKQVLEADWHPYFQMDLRLKDSDISRDVAKRLGVPLPVNDITTEIYRIATKTGMAKEGTSALIKVYEKWAGVQVRK